MSATPRLNPDDRRERIKLTGELPSPLNPPPGCAFNARCRRRFGPCTQLQPQLKDYGGQLVACFAVDQMRIRKAPRLTARSRSDNRGFSPAGDKTRRYRLYRSECHVLGAFFVDYPKNKTFSPFL